MTSNAYQEWTFNNHDNHSETWYVNHIAGVNNINIDISSWMNNSFEFISNNIQTFTCNFGAINKKLTPEEIEKAKQERIRLEGVREKARKMLAELLPKEVHDAYFSQDGFWHQSQLKPSYKYFMKDPEPRIKLYNGDKLLGGLCVITKEQFDACEDEIMARMAVLLLDERKLIETAHFWPVSGGEARLDPDTFALIKR